MPAYFYPKSSSPLLFTNNMYGDAAMAVNFNEPADVGGIDFNPTQMDLQTQGNGIEFNFPTDPAQWQNLNIQGFTPIIFKITPVTNLQLFLGITNEKEESSEV